MDNESNAVQPPKLEARFAALGTVRHGDCTWPADKLFPWTDVECAAFARGHRVYWPLTLDDILRDLPGRVEMIDRYAQLKS